ncbi:cyclic pyranopterin monophosphate synthase [Peptococcaceae bacterium CEB3]|nr:cyclic pyranopterin monophosphate synthase [Peptococcaceae bacterium CEB3]
MLINKQRNREDYSFANINLLGKCNVDCYFCLGKDIESLLSKHDQISTHFSQWENFEDFLNRCQTYGIKKLYITGQNTDSLLYKYLDELMDYLHNRGFTVGLRTNGYLASKQIQTINKCTNSVGYSVHTINQDTNKKIMGRRDLPDWESIIPATKQPRVAIVVNRHNVNEFFDILRFLSKFPNIKYIQARRISTDTRLSQLQIDISLYEELFQHVKANFVQKGEFDLAQIFEIYGQDVCFWRTVETSVNSINYFTDGTISDKYFVVEGYLDKHKDLVF